MIIKQCPHCGTRHIQMTERFTDSFGPTSEPEFWKILRCQNNKCSQLVLAIVDNLGIEKQIYPVGQFDLDSQASIPQEIKDDFREAGLCLGTGCYKASLVMSRRVLQRCLKEQGCTQHNLVDAINHAISENILRTPFHSIAEEIRQYGNLGAHPDDDQLTNANRDNAQQVLDFTRMLIHEFYEVPHAADRLRQNRQQS